MRTELQYLAWRLMEAGIPPEAIGEEMIVLGAGIFSNARGALVASELFARCAETFARDAAKIDADRTVKH